MISLTTAVHFVLVLVVAGMVFWLLFFLIQYVDPPEPFKKVANGVLMVLAVLVVIGVLLSLVNGQPLFVP